MILWSLIQNQVEYRAPCPWSLSSNPLTVSANPKRWVYSSVCSSRGFGHEYSAGNHISLMFQTANGVILLFLPSSSCADYLSVGMTYATAEPHSANLFSLVSSASQFVECKGAVDVRLCFYREDRPAQHILLCRTIRDAEPSYILFGGRFWTCVVGITGAGMQPKVLEQVFITVYIHASFVVCRRQGLASHVSPAFTSRVTFVSAGPCMLLPALALPRCKEAHSDFPLGIGTPAELHGHSGR